MLEELYKIELIEGFNKDWEDLFPSYYRLSRCARNYHGYLTRHDKRKSVR